MQHELGTAKSDGRGPLHEINLYEETQGRSQPNTTHAVAVLTGATAAASCSLSRAKGCQSTTCVSRPTNTVKPE